MPLPCNSLGSTMVSKAMAVKRLLGRDRSIYWTLGNFLKPLATITSPKSPTFIGNFCKGVKIFIFPMK